MIFQFFFSIPAYLIQQLIQVLPDGGAVPEEWVEAVYQIWAYVNMFSFIVPVDTLVWCLGIAISFHITILGIKVFNWVISKIPFIGK